MSAITKRDIKMCSKEEESGTEMRRGPWTLEEDSILIHYIARHGEGRWNMLAKSAGLKRNGKSCRLRWLNYLKPDIKRGNLTPQEQLSILDLHSRWGNRWSKIAQHLPGRTDNEIKNYWRTRVQKQARQLNIESGSKKFIDAIRYFWMPRLAQKVEQKQSSPSTTLYSSLTADTNLHVSSSSLSSPMLSANNNSVIPYSLSSSPPPPSSFQQPAANFPGSFCSNNPSNFPSSADSWQFWQQQILGPSSSEIPASPSCYMLENNNNACYSNQIQENLLGMNNMMATSFGYGMDNNNLMNLQQEPATTTMMETYDMLPFDYYYYYHQPTTAESDWTTLGNMAETLWNMEAL